jgi:hypothetical protein
MSSFLANPQMAGLLGTYNNYRGKLNTITLVTAFVLSIMVINNYRQCEAGKGYPEDHGFVSLSYGISVTILVITCVLFGIYILGMVTKRM